MAGAVKPRKTRIGLIQMRCAADPSENMRRAVERIREAAARGARLICLPELFRSPYFCQSEDYRHFALAESVPGPTTRRLARLARTCKAALIAPLFEKRAAGLYHNTAAILDADGRYLGKYRKMHIPDDPLYYEKFYFTPGDLGFRAWKTRHGTIGALICWDQWFPEAARLTVLEGADLIFYPTAIGWHPKEKARLGKAQHEAWEMVQRAHAVANGCYVAAVNRVGLEKSGDSDGLEFFGGSFVADPSGQVLARASLDREEIVLADVEWDRVNDARIHWPFLRDRRVDAYGGITQRFLENADQGTRN